MFISRNLVNFLNSKKGYRHFCTVLDEAVRESGSQDIDESFVNYLAHHVVFVSYEMKSSSNTLTGEWLVFHKHEGVNYYLTLAFHRENDENIYSRVVATCELDNFPFRL